LHEILPRGSKVVNGGTQTGRQTRQTDWQFDKPKLIKEMRHKIFTLKFLAA
jgi:hypothetical protein